MRFSRYLITIFLLVAFTACDSSLQKATQQLLTKEKTSTPRPPEPVQNKDTDQAECPEQDPHPIGESIAEKFNTTYGEVITWYCDGYIFEDILLALQTSEMADVEPEELLQKLETKSWDRIWDELGIVDQGD